MPKSSSQPRLVERVYGSLLEAISSGALPPGTRLAQEWLAERLKVSRQPVGQALALLKSQGFVCDVGRRGLMVAPLEVEFVKSIYAVRGALDRLAARTAAMNLAADAQARARPIRARPIRARPIMEAGRRALASGSVADLIAADIAFHGFIYELSGNAVIGDSMRLLWNRLRRVMSVYLEHSDWAENTWDEHDEILERILARDAEGAESLAGAHVDNAIRLLGAELSEPRDDLRFLREPMPFSAQTQDKRTGTGP
ncbi:MAG: GntR family transcriptional regulator [Alphaproteobacteria bacterium]